ncbi:MAG: class I SAM-dependent methyltransferase [Synechococcales bacterium]|nr:class I SAM-dependent methyltransferase [Synechococcales bacterium]
MFKNALGLSDALHDYILKHSLQESDILTQLRQETAKLPQARMQISPDQGQFMGLLVRLMGAKKTLEVGVFTGYSSLCVAMALPAEGQLIACDINEDYTAIARRYWQQAGVSDKIQLRLAPALETLDQLLAEGQAGTFDFVFIDADKGNYQNYFDRSLQLVRSGGLIAIDNVLWSGRVVEEQSQDKIVQTMRIFNQAVAENPAVQVCLLPIADGLTLAMKR